MYSYGTCRVEDNLKLYHPIDGIHAGHCIAMAVLSLSSSGAAACRCTATATAWTVPQKKTMETRSKALSNTYGGSSYILWVWTMMCYDNNNNFTRINREQKGLFGYDKR